MLAVLVVVGVVAVGGRPVAYGEPLPPGAERVESRPSSPRFGLTGEQRRVATNIVRIGRRRGESHMEIKAAMETGIVEAKLTNPPYGDGSSVGWRQETVSSYPGVNRMDLKASINRFYDETDAVEHRYRRAHRLAQAVQRSCCPDRYRRAGPRARRIIRALDR